MSLLKWRLKCKNILECELVAFPEPQQCKKVIAWSGDFGMDQYVSWGLTKQELKLDTIWTQFEEFCKPQSNEVQARFDLLTSFHQGSKSVDEWYNSVQAQVTLTKYPPETAKILYRDIFWFFLCDEDFVSKTINEGSVDLDKFPASKVCQFAKKYESSKATARHIKQVAGEMQATEIHLMGHQLQIKCVQAQSKIDKKPACLITNLPYRLKQHENRNLYLRARLDTCADVNIIPASVYKLVFP